MIEGVQIPKVLYTDEFKHCHHNAFLAPLITFSVQRQSCCPQKITLNTFVLLSFVLENIIPFCGATGISVLDFWWWLPWFQSQGGSLTCMLCYLHAMNSSDSPLLWHLLTSWQSALQLSLFDPHTCTCTATAGTGGTWTWDGVCGTVCTLTVWATRLEPLLLLLKTTFAKSSLVFHCRTLVDHAQRRVDLVIDEHDSSLRRQTATFVLLSWRQNQMRNAHTCK